MEYFEVEKNCRPLHSLNCHRFLSLKTDTIIVAFDAEVHWLFEYLLLSSWLIHLTTSPWPSFHRRFLRLSPTMKSCSVHHLQHSTASFLRGESSSQVHCLGRLHHHLIACISENWCHFHHHFFPLFLL